MHAMHMIMYGSYRMRGKCHTKLRTRVSEQEGCERTSHHFGRFQRSRCLPEDAIHDCKSQSVSSNLLSHRLQSPGVSFPISTHIISNLPNTSLPISPTNHFQQDSRMSGIIHKTYAVICRSVFEHCNGVFTSFVYDGAGFPWRYSSLYQVRFPAFFHFFLCPQRCIVCSCLSSFTCGSCICTSLACSWSAYVFISIVVVILRFLHWMYWNWH